MENKSILSNLTQIENYIEKMEQEKEDLRGKLAMYEHKEYVASLSKNPEAPSAFDCLAVTQVTVWPFNEGPSLGHMKGLAQIVLNDQLVIRGLRIMEGEYGLFVGYPADPFYKGEDYRTLVNPLTRQLKEHIEACVLEKYHAAIGDNEKED